MGGLGRKAPQQLAGKSKGIKVLIFGNSARPLTARNDPKLPIWGSFWGIAGYGDSSGSDCAACRAAGMARARSQHEDAERRTLAPTQKSSATAGSGGSSGHSGLTQGTGGGREAWEALPPQASAPQPWSYCARSGGRAPHNSWQVG